MESFDRCVHGETNSNSVRRSTVLIFRDSLLPPSETFILNQGQALERFSPCFVGSKRVASGIATPLERTVVINDGTISGRISEIGFKAAGILPGRLRALRQLTPALLHAHFLPDGVKAIPLAKRLSLPMIVTAHGYDATVSDEHIKSASKGGRLYLHRRPQLMRDARLFLAVSAFVRGQLVERGFPAERIRVHYTGVDTVTFSADPHVERKPIVLFVGRLVEVKGCDYLIKAMTVVQQHVDAELIVIGDGPLRPQLEMTAKTTLKRAQFLGTLPQSEVRSWMNRASVFSVPSVKAKNGQSEAFGMVFAEAQSMGLPVVSFASGGIPEVVAHGETGFLAQERDWQTLGLHINALLADETVWRKISTEGRRRMDTLFNLRTQSRALEDIYRAVICGHSA